MLQVAVVIVAGQLFFGIPWPGDWFALLVFLAAGVVCFASLGVALSHAIPNSESAPAYVNAVFLPMILLAGVFYDDENAPGVLRDLAEALPLKHLIDGLSGAMVHGEGLADHVVALVVLGAVGGGRDRARRPRLLVGGAPRLSAGGYSRPTSSTQIAPLAAAGPAAGHAEAGAAVPARRAGSRGAAGCSASCAASRAGCRSTPQP